MRVLFITNIPSPYRVKFWNELGKYLDLTVWFESRGHKGRDWEIEGLGDNFNYKFLPGFTLSYDKHINTSIISWLRKDHFDVYILGCYSSPTEMMAIEWLKYNGIPFLLNSDGGFVSSESRFRYLVKRHFISSAAGWLSSGSNCTAYLEHYGALPEKIFTYPFTSVSRYDAKLTATFRDPEWRRKLGIPSDEIVLLSVGRFIASKGWDSLLHACARMKADPVRLILVGGGPLKDKLLKLSEDLGLSKITIIDFVPPERLSAYYAAADIFAFPTLSDVWGLVLNEAISHGLPVVSSDRAGATFSLVQDNVNGFVVKADDSEELYKACRKLIDNPGMRQRFSIASFRIAEGYTIEKMADRHREIIEWAIQHDVRRK